MVETKKLDEAERYYEKALKVNSQDERAKDELLYIYKLKNGELQFNAQKLIKPDPYNACNIGYLVREFSVTPHLILIKLMCYMMEKL